MLLKKSRLYAIVDKKACAKKSPREIAQRLKQGGADIIQLRDKISDKKDLIKTALQLKTVLARSRCLFIINDFLDIAKIIDCDGVHLGQNDVSVKTARKILGEHKLIGVSTHSLRQARAAQKKGADYIGVGPIFETRTKNGCRKGLGTGILGQIKKVIRIPFFAIGGINAVNINEVLSKGSRRIALCSALCKAGRIKSTTAYFKRLLPQSQ